MSSNAILKSIPESFLTGGALSPQVQPMTSPSYVLVTPVKNEEKTIGSTIQSVRGQSLLPLKWVIVDDGSTDSTNTIIAAAAAACPWIHHVRRQPAPTRSFSSVVHAIEHGRSVLSSITYTYIGILDADILLPTDYYNRLLGEFANNRKLGLAGGVVIDVGLPRDKFPRNRKDVPGAVQLFRRECLDRIGPLLAVPEGGWDGLTCAAARMHGFETRLVTEIVVDHLKPRNISEGGAVRRKWQMGVRDYAIGYTLLFETFKCLGRLRDRPFVIGAIAWWVGFCTAAIAKLPRIVPDDLLSHIRREQRVRLASTFRLRNRRR